jgi:hypothetical protein
MDNPEKLATQDEDQTTQKHQHVLILVCTSAFPLVTENQCNVPKYTLMNVVFSKHETHIYLSSIRRG